MNALVAPLFETLQLRNLLLKNRIVMAPMTRSFSPSGVPGNNVAAYYRRRVDGGTGLVITEGVGVDHPAALGEAGLGESDLPHMYGEAALEGWRRVVAGVHDSGGVIFPQLWHQGVMRKAGTGPHPEVASSRPSGLWGPSGRTTSLSNEDVAAYAIPTAPMSEEEIADVIAAYGRSAANAIRVGFDGIAIHGAHGYLPDNFLWEETNRRTDRWGGDRVRRAQFPAEVVKAIRREIGLMPIVFRFSQWKQQDFRARLAQTPQELEEVLTPLADAGVDVFDASVRYFDRAEFDGSALNLAGWAKKVTGKLSMAVGGIGLNKGFYDSKRDGGASGAAHNFAPLIERFNRGEFDLVAVGRSLLHDPDWPRKVRHGEALQTFSEESLKILR